MDVQDATTELPVPDRVKNLSNTTGTVLVKTYETIALARSAFINSSATQSWWAAIFPQKSTMTFALLSK